MATTLSEHSKRRIVWDSGILSLILLSSVLVPYQTVFQGSVLIGGSLLLYAIDLVFLADIWLNFRTTFRHQGVEVTDRSLIARRYRRSMFVVDLIASAPFDLLLLLLQPNLTIEGQSAVLVLRALRFLRLVRLFVIFGRWERVVWTNPGYLRIGKFLMVILVMIHWIASAWYLVAAAEGFPADSWVVRSGIVDAGAATHYIRSLYWTITTMTTVGYGDIVPMRTIEYVISMFVMFLGASMYAFIIGNVASLLSNLDSTRANHRARMETVTGYLRNRRVPHALAVRVRNYYEYFGALHGGVGEDRFLRDLPMSLRLEVLQCLTHDLLQGVPLFKYCSTPLRNSLLMALKPRTYDPTSRVVREGEVGREIYFVSQGTLEVVTSEGTVAASFQRGDYFGHISLLVKEKRTADVVARSYAEIFVLPGEAFEDLRRDYPELRDAMTKMSTDASKNLPQLVLDGIVL